MGEQIEPMGKLLYALKERAKELKCLYQIEEWLTDYDQDLKTVFAGILEAIPPGWQFPEACVAQISYQGTTHRTPDFRPTPWSLSADIIVQGSTVGQIGIYYTKPLPLEKHGPFLEEEEQLIHTIAKRLSDFILHRNLRLAMQHLNQIDDTKHKGKTAEWRIAVDLSRRMDDDLYTRLSRKMLNYLCWHGVSEAKVILQQISSERSSEIDNLSDGQNRPRKAGDSVDIYALSREVFEIADQHLPDDEIFACVQRWMQEDRASFLMRTLVNLESSISDIADAVRRFSHLTSEGIELSDYSLKGMRVSLLRRLITDSLDYIKIAKNYVEVEDFHSLLQRMIYPRDSHGQLGGKSAGLLLAWHILKKRIGKEEGFNKIRTPKTWYITSDGLHNFMRHNNLEEVTEQKYKDIGQVRQEYPHVVQLFKASQFTPEIIQGLSMALDDFGHRPLIVRSSSLLEDRFGAVFSGKYKSLFLANQGKKRERLKALMDAIAEVYASTFSPDPLEYRSERGLIDFKEEMGIIIQEVVGRKVGKYFLPAYAGVVFSHNEFRWSPRIKREDGLVRLVPGLGTRAVDRLSDDYPTMVALGQPQLRVNVTTDEIVRYSPNKIDLIDMDSNSFETVDVKDFFRECGEMFPASTKLISVLKEDYLRQPSPFDLDFHQDEIVVTFDGLINNTDFVPKLREIVTTLEKALGTSVDVEFASDGENFYLLQCRPQGLSIDSAPAPIPKDVAPKSIVFTANKYVSNGFIPDITHIVYVDPQEYSEIGDLDTLMTVGRVIGKLNAILPKTQFILMGPGRWGSRGDIKLGVNVSYSDINSTSMLIEIARKKGNYVPDLSFGTHFFQDLAEASIRYLPLYPDDENVIFNQIFLTRSANILQDILPEHTDLNKVIRVIDVPAVTNGKILRVLMNAELDEALAMLATPSHQIEKSPLPSNDGSVGPTEEHWRWRQHMSERLASDLDARKFGVEALYLFGSTKNATAGPASDIDLLVHFKGDHYQRVGLNMWLEGWSLALDEMNYQRTGYRTGGLLDIHIITEKEITERSSFAVKIGAITDPARKLTILKRPNSTEGKPS
ncbi:PEP/pyruvate-binding domain-containing protein [Calditrichota bacterium]